jgi:hypothetical protein
MTAHDTADPLLVALVVTISVVLAILDRIGGRS